MLGPSALSLQQFHALELQQGQPPSLTGLESVQASVAGVASRVSQLPLSAAFSRQAPVLQHVQRHASTSVASFVGGSVASVKTGAGAPTTFAVSNPMVAAALASTSIAAVAAGAVTASAARASSAKSSNAAADHEASSGGPHNNIELQTVLEKSMFLPRRSSSRKLQFFNMESKPTLSISTDCADASAGHDTSTSSSSQRRGWMTARPESSRNSESFSATAAAVSERFIQSNPMFSVNSHRGFGSDGNTRRAESATDPSAASIPQSSRATAAAAGRIASSEAAESKGVHTHVLAARGMRPSSNVYVDSETLEFVASVPASASAKIHV